MTEDTVYAVSVVVPVYCHSKEILGYLEQALKSISEQTFRDFEVIVIDDASPIDISPVLEDTFGLPGFHVVRNETNRGHVASRNRGIEEAKAPLIAFMDHDDYWDSQKLQTQVDAFKANPDAGMIFCDIEVVGPRRDTFPIDQSGIPVRPSFGYLSTHIRTVITSSAVMVKKEAMEEIGRFDDRYSSCDDYDAWLKILMHHPIVRIPKKLAFYRLHESNVNYCVDSKNDQRLLTELILGYWKKAPVTEKIKLLPSVLRKLAGRVYYGMKK